jgi:hypothetical protein
MLLFYVIMEWNWSKLSVLLFELRSVFLSEVSSAINLPVEVVADIVVKSYDSKTRLYQHSVESSF